ncbi:hypothetical protein CDAR_235841 [Caerostris darwini]|uniref:Uncharacterized protein n=1 Tax=Caerostris darwini TaxID=1538125 RepID=A0AAV4WZI1_9ARAC|nr:hypothetical protein CDAR_235841 [Caerostris darwini]
MGSWAWPAKWDKKQQQQQTIILSRKDKAEQKEEKKTSYIFLKACLYQKGNFSQMKLMTDDNMLEKEGFKQQIESKKLYQVEIMTSTAISSEVNACFFHAESKS